MNLEEWYWVAGIVVAIVAVIGLFLVKQAGSGNNQQTVKFKGDNNKVSQRAERPDDADGRS